MNISEHDLNNINQIDLECNIADDDDFIVKDIDSSSTISFSDDRDIKSKTGIVFWHKNCTI